MIAAVAGFLGGIVGSAMFGGNGSSHTTKTVYVKPENPIIGYHKWMEQRRDEEIANDNKIIEQKIHDLEHTCPMCHNEIECKFNELMTPEGRELCVKIGCKCQQFKRIFELPYYVSFCQLTSDSEHYGKEFKQIKDYIKDCFVKIRGEVDRNRIRNDYLENKQIEKQMIERYYGKI